MDHELDLLDSPQRLLSLRPISDDDCDAPPAAPTRGRGVFVEMKWIGRSRIDSI
jgi:hypothetical protein